MDGVCSTLGRTEKYTQNFSWRNLRGEITTDIQTYGLQKENVDVVEMGVRFRAEYRISVFIKGMDFFKQLSDC